MKMDNNHNITIKYQALPGVKAPEIKSEGAHCADIYAKQMVKIYPGEIVIAKTKLFTEIPQGYGARILERSSMPVKHRVTVKAGTIDSDYRNEWGVVLYKMPGLTLRNALRINVKKYKEDIENEEVNNKGLLSKLRNWAGVLSNTVEDYISSNRPTVYLEGDRIAQVKFEPTVTAKFQASDNLSKTERNMGGFGSSGK